MVAKKKYLHHGRGHAASTRSILIKIELFARHCRLNRTKTLFYPLHRR